MRNMRNITIAALSFLVTFAIGMAARAQSTSSMILNLTQKSFQVSADDVAQVDLLKELKKQNPAGALEIQMLRFKAKTGVGGAQFFLRINGQFPDSQSLETDPDQFDGADMTSAGNVELRNTIRSNISEATLLIQGFSNAKISAIEVVMGAVTEVAILGHYADQQVQIIGGNADTNTAVVLKPTDEALANIQSRYYAQPEGAATAAPQNSQSNNPIANQLAQTLMNAAAQARGENAQAQPQPPTAPAAVMPAVVALPVAATPVAVAPAAEKTATQSNRQQERSAVAATPVAKSVTPVPEARCVVNGRGSRICVGDKVKNRWGFKGIVQDMKEQNGEMMILVKFGFGDTKWREVDSVSK